MIGAFQPSSSSLKLFSSSTFFLFAVCGSLEFEEGGGEGEGREEELI